MRSKILNLTVIALLMGVFVVALVPTAEAQGSASIIVKLSPASGDLKPLQGFVTVAGQATYTADPTARSSVIGVPIQYTVKNAPSWASVTITPQSDVIAPPSTPGQSESTTVSFTVIISASDQAPAFSPSTLEIQAIATKPAAGAAATGVGSVPIQAGFFSIIDVQLAESIKVDRPQTPVIFPLTITNFGNANTKVSFEVLQKTESLEVPVPVPVTLQSKQAGGNIITATVPLTIQTPYKNGYMNEVGVVNYKITSAYALDPKLKGDETVVSVLVTTKGFYMPGFEPLVLVGILGAAAMFMRRRA